jgi:hypothetical protein
MVNTSSSSEMAAIQLAFSPPSFAQNFTLHIFEVGQRQVSALSPARLAPSPFHFCYMRRRNVNVNVLAACSEALGSVAQYYRNQP